VDLAASIVTAAATVGLAVIAYVQIRAGQAQARDAKAQSAAALSIAQEQAAASVEVARETRAAAERQWQPRIIAHAWHGPVRGTGDDAAPDEMAVRYYLSNEGTGPAFNVEHGVEVAGALHTWEDNQWRAIRAGEFTPQLDADSRQPVPSTPIVAPVKLSEWHDGEGLVYWTRFENLLGERFEVRNYPDPTRPAEFRRVP
jgi:hypothetical protein